MLLGPLLCVAAAWAVGVGGEPGAARVRVAGVCHDAAHLFDLRAPFRSRVVIPKMGMLRSKNLLFYSFEPNITEREYYKVGFVYLERPASGGVLSAAHGAAFNFGTFDVDQTGGLLYLGGDDGIYVLDTAANRLSSYSSRGDTITNIMFRSSVYFTKAGENRIMQKKGDQFYPYLEYEPVKNFIIDKYGVTVFLSDKGLFAAKDGGLVRLSANAFFRGLTMDLDDAIYVWWIGNVYRVVVEKKLTDSKLVRVAHIPALGAMMFDNGNNILFTADRGLFRLTATGASEC